MKNSEFIIPDSKFSELR